MDLVVVPASVKDDDGRFIYDLQQKDFAIFEDGRLQEITQLSVDPVPLSVAVLADTGIEGAALRRLANAIVSLSSAFILLSSASFNS